MAKTVLVVDDNEVVRKVVCRLFMSEEDFELCGEAKDGLEAIEKTQQLHPDLIVMDLSMPVMNGLEAARVIKKIMPSVRIIMFSEYSDILDEEKARFAGISALVSKSQQASTLIARARSLFTENAA